MLAQGALAPVAAASNPLGVEVFQQRDGYPPRGAQRFTGCRKRKGLLQFAKAPARLLRCRGQEHDSLLEAQEAPGALGGGKFLWTQAQLR